MMGGNLLELAREKGNEAFSKWFRERLSVSGVSSSGLYTTGILYETLLGISLRSYSYWENELPDFPVKVPCRLGLGKTAPRAYTPENVVDIAYWYFLRKLREDADTYTVAEVAGMLSLPVEEIISMMQQGAMPGTGQDIPKEQYQEWLHSRVRGGLVEES